MTSSTRSVLGRLDLRQLFAAGVEAANPEAVTQHACAGLGPGPWTVLALGKAACAMARGACAALGDRVAGGLVVSNAEDPVPLPFLLSSHPYPDERSVRAAEQLLAVAAAAPGPVLALISGGGSSLAALPAPGLELADKVAAVRSVMEAGATIEELNVVRKHLSSFKGGRLGAVCKQQLVTFAISDVVGDLLHVIASGPTVADPSTFADARLICMRHHLWEVLPQSVRDHLEAGCLGQRQSSPARVVGESRVIAGGDAVARSVEAMGREHETTILVGPLAGDVALVATSIASRARKLPEGTLLIGFGETTVDLSAGAGVGGRAQHLALLLARELAGTDLQILSAGTDGIDGNSPAAGAVVDGCTWAHLVEAGVDPGAHLEACDSHSALVRVQAAFETGPTGVNYADLLLIRRP